MWSAASITPPLFPKIVAPLVYTFLFQEVLYIFTSENFCFFKCTIKLIYCKIARISSKSSAIETLTAGDGWTTAKLFGSSRCFKILSTKLICSIAPNWQFIKHWPQFTHLFILILCAIPSEPSIASVGQNSRQVSQPA